MCEICNVSFFPWWLKQTCNRTNVDNPYFKGKAYLLFAFIFSILVTEKRDYTTSFILPTKQYRKHFRYLEFIIVIWCEKYAIFPWWLEQTCNRTNVPNPKFRRIRQFSTFLLSVSVCHFQQFHDLKRDFWISFILLNQFIIGMWCVKS